MANTRDLNNIKLFFSAIKKGDNDFIEKAVAHNTHYLSTTNKKNKTPLYYATYYKQYNIARLLLNKGANPNQICGHDSNTPLYLAAKKGHLRIAKLLMRKGAYINKPNKHGISPLHVAAANNQSRIVNFLLQKHASPDQTNDNDGSTPLYIAAQNGALDVVNILLKHGTRINQACKNDKTTAIYAATIAKQWEVVKVLLDHGAHHHDEVMYDNSILSSVIKAKQHDLFSRLLDLGIDVNQVLKKNENSFLSLAIEAKDIFMVKTLLKLKANIHHVLSSGDTALHVCVKTSNIDICKLLLEQGAKTNIFNKNGHTPLTLAIDYKQFNIAIELLENKPDPADPNLVFSNLTSPLHRAVLAKHLPTITTLCKYGADPYKKNYQGENALTSSINNDSNILTFLLNQQINPNEACISDGSSLLLIATKRKDIDAMRTLLQFGAYINKPKTSNGSTPIHVAAKKKSRLSELTFLLEKGANPNEIRNSDGAYPIHLAATYLYGNCEGIELLHKYGAILNCKNKKGETPIYLATKEKNWQVVYTLLKLGAKHDTIAMNGNSLLFMAAANKQYDILKFLLDDGVDPNQVRLEDGATPLMLAIYNEDVAAATLLIEKNANVNDSLLDGTTPLIWAAIHGLPKIAELLLQHGANINQLNHRGSAAIHLAALNGSVEIIELLLKHKNGMMLLDEPSKCTGNTPLHMAAEYRKTAAVKILLKHGADPSKKSNGMSPIFIAIQNDSHDIVELFLQHNVNPNTNCYKEIAPLHVAAALNQLTIAETLLKYGAYINKTTTDMNGLAPLHVAVNNANLDFVLFLLKQGANPNQTSENSGQTPLYLAAINAQENIAQALIKLGASVSQGDYDQILPIHCAVAANSLNLIKLLLNQNPSHINARMSSGFTPLFLAARVGNVESLQFLLSQGADPAITSHNGVTPLQIAKENNHKTVVDFLSRHMKLDTSEAVKPSEMPVTIKMGLHTHVIKAMQSLNYQSNDGGICFGISFMALQAFLSQDIRRFHDRVQLIVDTPKNEFLNLLETNRKQVQNKLTVTSPNLLEMPPFFEGIEMYFHAHELYRDWFNINNKPYVQDERASMPLVMSHILEAKGGIEHSGNFIGCYDDYELKQYFRSLRRFLIQKSVNYPIGLFLISLSHAIFVGYDNKDFTFFDINQGIAYNKNAAKTAQFTKIAFQHSKIEASCFQTKLFVAKEHAPHFTSILNEWYTSDAWKKIHTITPEKIQSNNLAAEYWLKVAAKTGDTNTVLTLLSNRTALNCAKKATAIYFAAQYSHIDIVNILLKNGAEIPLESPSPFGVAIMTGRLDIVKLLARHLISCSINFHKNCKDYSPLLLAAEYNHCDVTEYLLSVGADVNQVTKKNESALLYAVTHNNLAMTTLLLKHGANPNIARDSDKFTPLILAAKNGYHQLVEILLDYDARSDDESNDANSNKTALHFAAEKGDIRMVKILLAKNTFALLSKTKDRQHAIDLAKRESHQEIVDLLKSYIPITTLHPEPSITVSSYQASRFFARNNSETTMTHTASVKLKA